MPTDCEVRHLAQASDGPVAIREFFANESVAAFATFNPLAVSCTPAGRSGSSMRVTKPWPLNRSTCFVMAPEVTSSARNKSVARRV